MSPLVDRPDPAESTPFKQAHPQRTACAFRMPPAPRCKTILTPFFVRGRRTKAAMGETGGNPTHVLLPRCNPMSNSGVTRRDFLKTVGATGVGVGRTGRAYADEKPPLTHLSAKRLAQMIANR
jgi:hypothetical protein